MEIKDVIELIKAVSDNGLTGFKIEQGDTKIVIKKEQPAVIQAVPALAGCQPADGAVPQTVQTVSGMPLNGSQGSPAPQTDTAVSDRVVACPLVGTFYSSPAPDAEDFVKVGDHVKKGQVIGIVEAMKLMNEIESEYDGVVEAIKKLNPKVPVVLRIRGTNEAEAFETLKQAGLTNLSDTEEAVRKAVELAAGRA